jgi:RimJ/RimL family protein N-acetyltransferase
MMKKALIDGELELVLEAKLPGDPEQAAPPAYKFAMRRTGTDEKIGEIGLKIGTPPAHKGHFWYRVFPEHRGNHHAARACRLLIPLARRHGINSLWITCRENNAASRRTAELAGAEFLGVIECPEGYEDWTGPVKTKCKYELKTEEMDNQ